MLTNFPITVIFSIKVLKLVKTRLYLDNCCFNRPYDDQTDLNIRLEAEAKLYIQSGIIENNFELAWSFMMDYEITANPFYDRQLAFMKWRNIAIIDIDPTERILIRGREIMQKNIKQKDAIHIACALKAECDYFLTTDRKILNKNIPEIKLINPLDFIRQFYTGGNEK
jgi:predicted nucleic acid-binding protein